MKIFVDGKYFDERNAKISVFDHGFLYGDGGFEGIRSYDGLVFKLNYEQHVAPNLVRVFPCSRRRLHA